MEIYYIQKNNEILELFVEKGTEQEKKFQALSEFLYKTKVLQENTEIKSVPLIIINTLPLEFKIIIKSPCLFFDGPLGSVISLLKINGFNLVPHEDNKIKVYYLQKDNKTLELFIDGSEKEERQFEERQFNALREFLQRKERLGQNTKQFGGYPLKIKVILESQFKIIIKSHYLFTDAPPHPAGTDWNGPRGSVISSLKANGFNPIPHQTNLPREPLLHRVYNKLKLR